MFSTTSNIEELPDHLNVENENEKITEDDDEGDEEGSVEKQINLASTSSSK